MYFMKYNRLKECLVEKDISQKWLSEKLSISTVTVNMWCKNKSQPPLKKMFEISEVLNVKPSELINE
jgi:transcriptional regulator with XRE-family HTH domain